jgi:hypothetical protein
MANVPSLPILDTLMMGALSSSQTSVLTRAIWRNIPEDSILYWWIAFTHSLYSRVLPAWALTLSSGVLPAWALTLSSGVLPAWALTLPSGVLPARAFTVLRGSPCTGTHSVLRGSPCMGAQSLYLNSTLVLITAKRKHRLNLEVALLFRQHDEGIWYITPWLWKSSYLTNKMKENIFLCI